MPAPARCERQEVLHELTIEQSPPIDLQVANAQIISHRAGAARRRRCGGGGYYRFRAKNRDDQVYIINRQKTPTISGPAISQWPVDCQNTNQRGLLYRGPLLEAVNYWEECLRRSDHAVVSWCSGGCLCARCLAV